MAESQVQKKNKKGRKKSEPNTAPVVMPASNDAKCCVESSSSDQQSLSQKLNIKTSENIEVTMVNDNKKQDIVDESSNKKKKKSKKKSKEVLKEANVENTDSKSLLNFSENGIQLVNHPEISVTFTGSCQPKDNEGQHVKDKDPPSEEKEKQNNNGNATSKKKKKKKKNGNSLPVVSTSTNETTYATPTYTKVVTSDNTCVLVVNNENLSVSTKSLGNSDEKKVKITESNINFSLPTEKQLNDVLFPKTFTPDTTVKLGNSVSIFPVLTDVNDNTSDQSTNIKLGANSSVKLETNSEATLTVPSEETNELPEKENMEDSKPTKAQLKAERRAKQEAQRAAKLAKTAAKSDANTQNPGQNKNPSAQKEKEKPLPKENSSHIPDCIAEKAPEKSSAERDALRKVRLFSHLPQCRKFDINAKIHPAILELGSQYNKGIICGSNARCVALLSTLREIINSYIPQPDKSFCRDLESNIQAYLSFLNTCRPLSVSMINAVKFLKHQINHIPSEMDIDKAKERLSKFINDFVKEEILLAKEAIGNSASAKIVDGDVILVFAHSSLVKDVLCKAHNENKKFQVIVTDSRLRLEGLEMLRYLVKQGLDCSYLPVNTMSYVMKEVSKVIIGAHALLSNGCVMSRLGSKQIARVASSYSVPVLVCCETYKFCERVLTDSFVHNELGEPNDISTSTLVSNDSLKNWHELPSLQLLNLLYDVTPPDLISMVITEKGVLPCTSVPVVLRVRYAGLHE